MSKIAKIACIGVVVAILAWVGYTYYSSKEEVETLQKEVVEERAESDELNHTLGVTQASAEVTVNTLGNVMTGEAKVRDEQAAIARAVAERVRELQARYPASVPLPAAGSAAALGDPLPALRMQEDRDQRISSYRIDGLWESYCQAAGKDACAEGAKK